MDTRGVTVAALAKRCGVSRMTIYRRIREYKIPTVKFGAKSTRIPHADAERIARYGLPNDR